MTKNIYIYEKYTSLIIELLDYIYQKLFYQIMQIVWYFYWTETWNRIYTGIAGKLLTLSERGPSLYVRMTAESQIPMYKDSPSTEKKIIGRRPIT